MWKMVMIVFFFSPERGPGAYPLEAYWPSEEECVAQGIAKVREILDTPEHPKVVNIRARCFEVEQEA
jgi:hypothetical protein